MCSAPPGWIAAVPEGCVSSVELPGALRTGRRSLLSGLSRLAQGVRSAHARVSLQAPGVRQQHVDCARQVHHVCVSSE